MPFTVNPAMALHCLNNVEAIQLLLQEEQSIYGNNKLNQYLINPL